MTEQEMIDRLVRNVPNMSKFSFRMSFGNPGPGPHTVATLQQFAKDKLETETDGDEKLLNIKAIYSDADDNDELLLP